MGKSNRAGLGYLGLLCLSGAAVIVAGAAITGLCCRTIRLNPFVRFLYFQMNYHTEHHMYASVPCHKLGRLRKAIGNDLPRAAWLVPAWIEIIGILRRQKREPSYQFVMPLPKTAAG